MHTPSIIRPRADTHTRMYVHPHIHVLNKARLPERPTLRVGYNERPSCQLYAKARLHAAHPCELDTSLCSQARARVALYTS